MVASETVKCAGAEIHEHLLTGLRLEHQKAYAVEVRGLLPVLSVTLRPTAGPNPRSGYRNGPRW